MVNTPNWVKRLRSTEIQGAATSLKTEEHIQGRNKLGRGPIAHTVVETCCRCCSCEWVTEEFGAISWPRVGSQEATFEDAGNVAWYRRLGGSAHIPAVGAMWAKAGEHKATCLGNSGPELAGRKLPIRVWRPELAPSQLLGHPRDLLKGKCPRSHAGGGRHRGAREGNPSSATPVVTLQRLHSQSPETTPTNEGEAVMGASSSIDITKESKVWVQNLRRQVTGNWHLSLKDWGRTSWCSVVGSAPSAGGPGSIPG